MRKDPDRPAEPVPPDEPGPPPTPEVPRPPGSPASPRGPGETDRESLPDLRVARVLEAGEHPNADRLLVLRIDLGDEERQLVAGLAGKYEPDALVGLHIVVVANLQPAKLRGEISEGMLLAAEPGDTLGLLLAPDAEPGTRLRGAGLPDPPERIDIGQFGDHELVADPEGVTLDGAPLRGARLVMDRSVHGRLR